MPKHVVKQVGRLLSLQGIEVDHYFAYRVPYLTGEQTSVRVAVEWTGFDAGGQATLSLLTGQGRSMPPLTNATPQSFDCSRILAFRKA